jgi:hypothetical protein
MSTTLPDTLGRRPRPGGCRDPLVIQGETGLLIESATQEVHRARQRHYLEVVERTRLRRLVEKVDATIELCEETHLQGIKDVPPDIAERAQKVFAFARKAVRLSGDEAAREQVEEVLGRRHAKITDVMDMLWTVEEIAFDLMLPWRTELPEDVELDDDDPGAGIWRHFNPAA